MNTHTENAIWIGLNNDCYSAEDCRDRVTYLQKNGSNRSAEEDRIASKIDLNKVDWAKVNNETNR